MSVGMKQRTKVCCTTDVGTSKIGNHKEQLEAWGGRHCPDQLSVENVWNSTELVAAPSPQSKVKFSSSK